MKSAAPAVEVEGLVKRYGGRVVLDGVTFSVASGEIVALLGPNGAGKTTTVEILEGYRVADGGHARVLGEDPATGGAALRARVGLMLQGGGGIDPRATPREILRLYASFHAPARDPDELLELVSLQTAGSTRYRRLSGGERQRLALALALVGRPEILLLDEPTAGMDPAGRATTRKLLRELRDHGTTILITTHDLVDVERLADRVAIVAGGRIVAMDTPVAIVAGARPSLHVRLAGPAPVEALAASLATGWPGARVEVEERLPGVGIRIGGVVPDPRLVGAVAGWAADTGVLIAELRTVGQGLEERYLELTGDLAVERGP